MQLYQKLKNHDVLRRIVFCFFCMILPFHSLADDNAPSLLIDFESNPGALVIATDETLQNLDDFTFDLKVRLANTRSGNFFWINTGWQQDGFYFQYYEGALVLGFGNQGLLAQVISPKGLIETGSWYRLSGVKDGDSARLYVNGREVASNIVAADVVRAEASLTIGAGDYTPAMMMQSFTLWAEPLTAAQIASNARNETPLDLPVPDIHYDAESVDGTSIENNVSDRYPAIFVLLEPLSDQQKEGWMPSHLETPGQVPDDTTTASNQEIGDVDDGPANDHERQISTDADSKLLHFFGLAILACVPFALLSSAHSATHRFRLGYRSFSVLERSLWFLSPLIAGGVLIQGQRTGLPSSSIEPALHSMLYLVVLLSVFVSVGVLRGRGRSLWELVSDRRELLCQIFVSLLLLVGVSAAFDLVRGLMSLQTPALYEARSPAIWIYAASLLVSAFVIGRRLHDMRLTNDVDTATQTDSSKKGQKLVPEADVARIHAKLEKALDVELLYRDPDLTLRQLSDAVGVTEHRVSEILNQHQQTSFYDFVNGRRIEEAKRLLLEEPERSVLDVALDVGFNSKSTFYAIFKKLTDQSPIAFRREPPSCYRQSMEAGNRNRPASSSD